MGDQGKFTKKQNCKINIYLFNQISDLQLKLSTAQSEVGLK